MGQVFQVNTKKGLSLKKKKQTNNVEILVLLFTLKIISVAFARVLSPYLSNVGKNWTTH